MSYSRSTTVDSGPTGDTVVQAVLDLDTDLTAIYTDLNTHEALTTGAHGITAGEGDIVGTDALQTLTRKTITSPTITGGTATNLVISGLSASLPVFTSSNSTLTSKSVADTLTALGVGSAAFYAYLTNNATDVTGDGTLYNMVGAIWTEAYDTHDCFSNGIFTAPHDGLYRFDSYLEINGLTSSHTGLSIYAKIEPAAQYNSFVSLNPYAISESGHVSFPASCLRLLSALDKVSLEISVTGGAKVIGIYGKGIQYIPYSYFAGYRVA